MDNQSIERIEKTMDKVSDKLDTLIGEVSQIRANEQIVESRFLENGRRVGNIEDKIKDLDSITVKAERVGAIEEKIKDLENLAVRKDRVERVEVDLKKVQANQSRVAWFVITAVLGAVIAGVMLPNYITPSSVIAKTQSK